MAGWESNPAAPQSYCHAASASLASSTAPGRTSGHTWAHLSTPGHTCTPPPAAQGTRPGHPAPRDPVRDRGPALPHAPSSSKVSPPSSPSSPAPPPTTCGSPLGPDIPPRPPAPRRRPYGAPGHARGLQPMGGQGALRVMQAGAAVNSVVSAEGAGRRRSGGRGERRWAGGGPGGQYHVPPGIFPQTRGQR